MPKITALAAAAVTVLFLAACGADEPATPTATSPATSPAAAASAEAAPAGDAAKHTATAECAMSVDDIRSVIASKAVTKVEVVGQCTTVAISTSLADGEAAAAKEICEAAAKVSYQGDINSIRVTGKSGDELSQGIAGAPCLA